MIDPSEVFSASYEEARSRFRTATRDAGGAMESVDVACEGKEPGALTIDVARFGPVDADRLVVISSGLHGVEGYFGSAVQVGWLRTAVVEGRLRLADGCGLLMLHGLNPWGMANDRRFDESNIDLNRNFLRGDEAYAGTPEGYARLDRLINPTRPPSKWEWFLPKALFALATQGKGAVRQAVAGGQHDFPKGLFFAGRGPAVVARLISERMEGWIGRARRVVHLDLHTGLGRWGEYELVVEHDQAGEWVRRVVEMFGGERVRWEAGPASGSAAGYRARGTWTRWLSERFADRAYDAVCAEFGTYGSLRVFGALRAENQAYHWTLAGDPRREWARARVREAFVPDRRGWRRVVLAQGMALVDRALESMGKARP